MRGLILIAALLAASAAARRRLYGTTCGTTWTTNSVTLTKSGTNLVLTTTDCPGYDWTTQSSPNTATVSRGGILDFYPRIAMRPSLFWLSMSNKRPMATACPLLPGPSMQVQSLTATFPATPTISTTPTLYVGIYGADNKTTPSTGIQGGPIGYAVNGVAIFGNSDADGNNAWLYEGCSFDNCGGHPNQDGEVRVSDS